MVKKINGTPRFQPLPDLSGEEFEALKADILEKGILYSVLQDEFGNTFDGHQRERVAKELGIKYPVSVVPGLSDEEKWQLALSLNVKRRHLKRPQMQALIEQEIKRIPDRTNTWIAEIIGVDHKTVLAARKKLESIREIPIYKKLRGKNGKSRITKYRQIITNTPCELLKARSIACQMPSNGKIMDTITAARHARRSDKAEIENGKVTRRLSIDSIKIFNCPFKKLEKLAGIGPDTVPLIATDPPYGREFLSQLDDLGEFAERVLTDGGLLVMYSGQYFLDTVMETIGKHLKYRWMIATTWDGDASLIHPLSIASQWKPILIFSKGNWVKRKRWGDILFQRSKEKDWHDWQQPLEEAETLVQYFLEPGDLIVDPLGGGFTTGVACLNLGRRFVGCDDDAQCVKNGRQRLAETVDERKKIRGM